MDTMDRQSGGDGDGLIKSPQNLVGGIALLLVAVVCYVALWDLRGVRGFMFGSGTMPRVFALLLGGLSLLVIASAFVVRGPKLERMPLRAPAFILAAIVFFGLTIRGVEIGGLTIPGLGLAISGFVTVLLAGAAMDDFKLGEGALFALAITAFCVFLFPTALGQPIPVWPTFLIR
jgi:putative tricarboxylic transport membrane protein